MSSFRKRFGNLTVAQAIEMNNVAWKYQKDCDWDPDFEYEVLNADNQEGAKCWDYTREMFLEQFEKWANS